MNDKTDYPLQNVYYVWGVLAINVRESELCSHFPDCPLSVKTWGEARAQTQLSIWLYISPERKQKSQPASLLFLFPIYQVFVSAQSFTYHVADCCPDGASSAKNESIRWGILGQEWQLWAWTNETLSEKDGKMYPRPHCIYNTAGGKISSFNT